MTPQQATEIREYLIGQLNANGFSDVVNEVYARLEEDYEESDFERSPRYLTVFFLSESIDVLKGLSNKNYEGLLSRLNQYVRGENRIDTISVELLNEGKQSFYDLKQLPNYSEIISTFNEVLEEIRKEN